MRRFRLWRAGRRGRLSRRWRPSSPRLPRRTPRPLCCVFRTTRRIACLWCGYSRYDTRSAVGATPPHPAWTSLRLGSAAVKHSWRVLLLVVVLIVAAVACTSDGGGDGLGHDSTTTAQPEATVDDTTTTTVPETTADSTSTSAPQTTVDDTTATTTVPEDPTPQESPDSGVPDGLVTPTGIPVAVLGRTDSGYLVRTPCGNTAEVSKGVWINGAQVVIDPGHGGPVDTGAIGPNGLIERDLNLTLGRAVIEELTSRGISAVSNPHRRLSDAAVGPLAPRRRPGGRGAGLDPPQRTHLGNQPHPRDGGVHTI